MPKSLNEPFFGYRFDKGAIYDGPTRFNLDTEIFSYIGANVTKYAEIRVTDGGDNLVIHIIDQKLIFPLAANQPANNRWDPALQQFVAISV